MNKFSAILLAGAMSLGVAGGCKDEPKPVNKGNPPATAKGGDDHPDAVAIGEVKQNGLTLKATQDEKIKAGGEGAFDLTISGFAEGQKPKTVRFWVGVESSEGSAKARADEEKPGTWHTHCDVPNPLPAGSKFWAEIEPATGEKFKVSFDLAK